MASSHEPDDITVAEFLEFELYFELAVFLQVHPRQLSSYKLMFSQEFAQCAFHVLHNVVSPQCRMHFKDKKDSRSTLGGPRG